MIPLSLTSLSVIICRCIHVAANAIISFFFMAEVMFVGRTDAEAETLILWPPHVKS